MENILDEVLSPKNIKSALEHLMTKRDASGIDGVRLSELKDFWEINGLEICRQIREGNYTPNIIREVEIVSYTGKRRNVSNFASVDRLILRALLQIIEPELDQKFQPLSFAYREGLGLISAVQKVVEYIELGDKWVAEIDIKKYFESISLPRMRYLIEKNISDHNVQELIMQYLKCKIENSGSIRINQRGLIQGSPISPVLSNLYLDEIDQYLEQKGYHYVRYADNINIYTTTDELASEAHQDVTIRLNNIGLDVNKDKSGIFQSLNRIFLGYKFTRDNKTNRIIATRFKNKQGNYNQWNRSAIQRLDKNYHIINDGILTKKDFTLLFENERGKKYLPVETVDSINIYSDAIFTSGFFCFINSKKLRVNIFDKYGRSVGNFVSTKNTSTAKTMLKQAEIYLDDKRRLDSAKKINMASMHNIRANLRYYNKKNSVCNLRIKIDEISEIIKEMNEALSIEQLLLIEARGRQKYYNSFNDILNQEGFYFLQRTKRPPKDPINAMISFANVYLYNRIATEIRKTSLDIRIGFLHSTNNRSETLNLDVAEVFKPIIVDRVVFTLINKHMINEKDYFKKVDGGGIYLNPEGKRILLEELEKKIYSKTNDGDKMVSYDFLIRKEIKKILRHVMYQEMYKPYKYSS